MFFLFHLEQQNSIIVLHCRDEQNNYIRIDITDFHHFFYCSHMFGISADMINQLIDKRSSARPVFKRNRSTTIIDKEIRKYVIQVNPVVAEPIYFFKPGYTRQSGTYNKITLAHPDYMKDVADALVDNGCRVYADKKISFVFRFLIEVGLNVGNWFTYNGHGWQDIKPVYGQDAVPNLVKMTYDIECASATGEFPQPERDPVIQIGVHIQTKNNTCESYLLTWRSTPPIEGTTVVVAQSEELMFYDFASLICTYDPDFLVTFNGNFFDNPYLLRRAEHFKWDKFFFIGRIPDIPATIKRDVFESKAHGSREQYLCTIPGRVSLDVCEQIRREYKDLRTYSLNACSAKWLSAQKDDVHHSQITNFWNGTDEHRHRLAKYCVRDVDLTYRLLVILKLDLAILSISRASVVDMNTALYGGQQLKSTILLEKFAKQHGYLCPFAHQENYADEEFAGALVLDIKPRHISIVKPLGDPNQGGIMCLDFSSLYPSIIIAFNLCYTTLIHPDDVHKMSPTDYYRSPTGDCFVTPHVREGLLPRLLKTLLEARNAAKKQMATATEESVRAVYDKLQDAIKKEGNSKYGYTGVGKGHLPCLAVSRSTTSIGQESLRKVINWVTANYPNEEIVYGDTDSVFVRCPGLSIEQLEAHMQECASRITTEIFGNRQPMKLAPEKVISDMIAEGKKHYAVYKKQDGRWQFYYRGIEIVRRDWCPLVKTTMESLCHLILRDRKYEDAYQLAHQTIANLYAGRIELQELLLGKGLSKDVDKYANPMTHTRLVQKMRQRDVDTAPRVGDRVCYVMVTGSQSDKKSDWSEDPLYVLENDIPINIKYYVENQLQQPLTRLLTPVFGEARVKSLFTGEHTMVRIQTVPKINTATSRGTLLGHIVVKSRPCLICKSHVSSATQQVCANCLANSHVIEQYRTEKQREICEIEDLVRQSEETCRRCQQIASDQPIVCGARDCPELYKRHARVKRLETERKKII